jgi:hypothetical protein
MARITMMDNEYKFLCDMACSSLHDFEGKRLVGLSTMGGIKASSPRNNVRIPSPGGITALYIPYGSLLLLLKWLILIGAR